MKAAPRQKGADAYAERLASNIQGGAAEKRAAAWTTDFEVVLWPAWKGGRLPVRHVSFKPMPTYANAPALAARYPEEDSWAVTHRVMVDQLAFVDYLFAGSGADSAVCRVRGKIEPDGATLQIDTARLWTGTKDEALAAALGDARELAWPPEAAP